MTVAAHPSIDVQIFDTHMMQDRVRVTRQLGRILCFVCYVEGR